MAVTIATPANYWIGSNALSIFLNALGEPNRVQASVASGAQIMCYVRGIKPASYRPEEGDETDYSKNGDGLEYDNGHNYRRWPLTVSPTYFNDNGEKYLYAAIPRQQAKSPQAMIVFPDRLLDIYGYEVVDLGRDVDPQDFVDTVVEHHIELGGLSALMTTTVPAMAQTIELLHDQAPWCKVMVGGAVLNPEYAEMVGADFYAKDANESARIAGEVLGAGEQ